MKNLFILLIILIIGVFSIDTANSDTLPSKIVLVSPARTTEDTTLTFTLKEDLKSTWYKLYLRPLGKSIDHKFARWYEIEDNYSNYPEVSCSGGECSITLDFELESGDYKWWIKGWNDSGHGDWSDGMSFTIADSVGINLKRFESSENLNDFLKQAFEKSTINTTYRMPELFADVENNAGTGPVYSGTNLQVKGVDELDTIKFDGKYLFVSPVKDNYHQTDKPSFIRILELSSTRTIEKGRISLEDHEKDIDGFYLVQNTGENDPDLLVTIGGKTSDMWRYWCNPWYWTQGETEIVIYDVTDPLAVTKIINLTFDGNLISSRRIDDKLYIVTRFTPTIPGLQIYTNDKDEIKENKELLGEITLDSMLPSLTADGIKKGSLIRAENCFFSAGSKIMEEQPTLITITMIDLGSPESPVSQSIVGSSETVYVSTEALYIATTKYNYLQYEDTESPVTTEIHKFGLGEDGPDYKASASVDGHLGWEEDKKSFRMGEYNDVLRIATSTGDSWNGTESTALTLLREEKNGSDIFLNKTASIKGIGKTGEKLYAARFLGNKAYLVTFKVTDPLYVFDLSDPLNPRQLGELHIDGYSDYLHPVSENLLLGIGKDAVADETSDDFGGRGAWYQGVKLSLFDVSDPNNPLEVQSLIFGRRGTSSDLLHDHHALAYLPPTQGRAARLAIPMELHDTEPANDYFDSENPWAHYELTHKGLYLFEIETGESGEFKAGIKKTGEIIVQKPESPENYFYSSATDRALLVDDRVHYIHDARVWSTDWSMDTEETGPN